MTTTSQAFAVIKARLEANTALPLRWQNEDAPALPDTPATFVYVVFDVVDGRFEAFGGGRGNNLQRNTAWLMLLVYVPRGVGMTAATDEAETLAAIFRSYRDDDISCFAATVRPEGPGSSMRPPGVDSEVDNYYCASAEIGLFFDLTG